MADRMFSKVSIQYQMVDMTNLSNIIDRTITDIGDISACIYQTAKSAVMLGMRITNFVVEVEYLQD